MRRTLIWGALLVAPLFSPMLFAQQGNSKSLTGGLAAAPTEESTVYTRTILIRPKESSNVLSSRLFPSEDKLHNGNAAPIFLRSNWEAFQALQMLRDLYEKGFMEKSLEELNVDEIARSTPLRIGELRRAAFRRDAGWEYPIGEEATAWILLPDVQESRVYFHALTVRARADIKQGKIDSAEDLICISLGLGKHVGATNFAVCRSAQIAVAADTFVAIEELMQHPEARNYYWDLTSLPRPMIRVRDVVQADAAMWEGTIPELANLDTPRTDEQWQEIGARILDSLSLEEFAGAKRDTFESRMLLYNWFKLSRERLPEIAPELAPRISKMSDFEVAIRYWHLRNKARTESHCKYSLLDFDQAIPRLIKDAERLAEDVNDELPFKNTPSWHLSFVTRAATLEQRIELLRTVEAIRDWSASHGGVLPESLDQLDLAVPRDCISGKAFRYELAEDKKSATLEGEVVEASTTLWPTPSKPVKQGNRFVLKLVE